MTQLVERFEGAVQTLIGDGPVKQRLVRAYSEFLEDLQDVELPTGASAFHDLHDSLHRVSPIGKETAVRATIQKMSSGEAAWHAETILRLYADLLSLPRRATEPLKSVAVDPATTPHFLLGSG